MSEQHPDLVVLGDLTDGALPDEERTAVERHLAGCEDCRSTDKRLAAVRGSLQDLGPVQMPAAVGARVRRALAQETPVGEPGPSVPAGGRPVPAVPAARRRSWRAGPGLVAASVIVLLVAVLGGAVLAGRHSDGESASSSAGSAGQAESGASPRNSVRTRTSSSGVNYTPSTLPRQLDRLLSVGQAGPDRSSAGASTAGGSGTRQSGALEALRSPARLARCLDAVTDSSIQTPIAVDYASWRGQPAVLLVLPGSTSGRLVVYVVPPSCGTSASTSLLYFAQLPR